MTIPTGVNHNQFYEIAKSKGIKITSRFVGVRLTYGRNGGCCWQVRVQDKTGKLLFAKNYPFTEQGEIEAGEKYKLMSERIGKRVVTKKRNKKTLCQ